MEQHQVEATSAESKRKRGGGMQQKIPSKFSYQDMFFSSMANYFIYSSAYPPFNTFGDESYFQMMNAVAGDKDFKSLTIPHLKIYPNAEHNTFKKIYSQSSN